MYVCALLCGIVQVILEGHHEQGSHVTAILQGEPSLLHLKCAHKDEQELLVHDQLPEGIKVPHDLVVVHA